MVTPEELIELTRKLESSTLTYQEQLRVARYIRNSVPIDTYDALRNEIVPLLILLEEEEVPGKETHAIRNCLATMCIYKALKDI